MKVLVDTSEKAWFTLLGELEGSVDGAETVLDSERAETLYAGEVSAWSAERAKQETGDDRYMAQVVKSGTLSDKVAAMTLLVQESPVHRLSTLVGLVGLAKSGKHASKMAIESLKELFGGDELLPSSRRLRTFGARVSASPAELVLRCFEAKLLELYGGVAALVEGYSKHQAKELRSFAVETAASLLKAKPEQEGRWLAMVVNKLGDPEGSVSASAVRALCGVLDAHRAMTAVVCGEVQSFASRPNLDGAALYKAITFLSQVYLSPELEAVADSLVEAYLALFAHQVARGGLKTKLLSALLTGLNRALPYVSKRCLDDKQALDALFLASHTATYSARVQALSLVERVASKDEKVRARFHRALYALAHSDDVRKTTRPTLFLNLCFKALKSDADPHRVAAQLKRLAQLAAHSTAAVAGAVVYLVAAVQPLRAARKLLAEPPAANADRADPLKREPRFAANDRDRLWEVALLRHHYHPSVRAFADQTLANGRPLDYESDPLDDFTLSNFLDRFAYRNPKQAPPGQTRHAKLKRIVEDHGPALDFYNRYLREAESAKKRAKRELDDLREDEDDVVEEDAVDDDEDLDDDILGDMDDDDDDDDAAVVDYPEEEEDHDAPRTIGERKSPFVDAEAYLAAHVETAAPASTTSNPRGSSTTSAS